MLCCHGDGVDPIPVVWPSGDQAPSCWGICGLSTVLIHPFPSNTHLPLGPVFPALLPPQPAPGQLEPRLVPALQTWLLDPRAAVPGSSEVEEDCEPLGGSPPREGRALVLSLRLFNAPRSLSGWAGRGMCRGRGPFQGDSVWER